MPDKQLPLPLDDAAGKTDDMPRIDGTPSIIHAYTSEDLEGDGGLVAVTDLAREVGFKWPVFVVDHLYYKIVPTDADKAIGQSITGRLWDVLFVAFLAARSSRSSDIFFDVLVQRAEEKETLNLWAGIGYNNTGQPHIVIGFPDDR